MMNLTQPRPAADANCAADQNGQSNSGGFIAQLPFSIGQKVRVVELNRPGVVISIHITTDGAKFETRYFWDGCAKEVYFYPWEIEARAD